jgi:hypothetical protein
MSRIEEIKSRLEKATPGPWVGDEFEMTAPKAPTLMAGSIKLVWAEDFHMSEEDADFVKHARDDVPYLLTRLEDAEETLKRVQNHCLCTRNIKGFDYHEKHQILGKPKSGSRWLVPFDLCRDYFQRHKCTGGEK